MPYYCSSHFSDWNTYKILLNTSYGLGDMIFTRYTLFLHFPEKQKTKRGFLTDSRNWSWHWTIVCQDKSKKQTSWLLWRFGLEADAGLFLQVTSADQKEKQRMTIWLWIGDQLVSGEEAMERTMLLQFRCWCGTTYIIWAMTWFLRKEHGNFR
jgi:hypothetical protein